MRTLNPTLLAALTSDTIKHFALIDIQMTSGTFYFTDLPYDITVGSATYVSDGGLVEYQAPRQSSQVDRETFKLTLSDNLGVLKPEVEQGLAGKNLMVRLGIFDVYDQPSTTDLLVSYKGYIDSVTYQNNFEQAAIVIEASSPMADLSLVKTVITSKSGMDQLSLTDTSFDSVIDKNESIVRWGR